MKPIECIVETAIYADDLDQAERFYRDVLGLTVFGEGSGPARLLPGGRPIACCWCFVPEATLRGDHCLPTGRGPGHFAMGIAAEDLDAWRERLRDASGRDRTRGSLARGGHSLYFRDPAGNSVELITPGLWGLPSGW